MRRRRATAEALAAGAALLAAVVAGAQNDDVPRPPRFEEAPPPPRIDAPPAERTPSLRAPERARLATLPEERAQQDEIVVIGQTAFRLPDLGTSLRQEQEAAAAAAARIRVTFLPLYDPERQTAAGDLFLVNRDEQRRHGVIELFRIRFGRGRD